jgi:PAS domain S-box-containing protein
VSALRQLLLLSPDALVVIDQSGTIQFANAQLSDLFGYSPEQLLGQSLETLLPERLRTAHVAHQAAFMAAPHQSPMGIGLELIRRRQNGAEFSVDISLRPCVIKGQLYVIGAIRDVSAQRQLERERADLLTNAVKYSPAGGPIQVRVVAQDERPMLRSLATSSHLGTEHEQSKYVEIQIRDEGLGIPAHQQSLIFGRFMRADNGRQQGIDGTGLGLYICRELVERQGGQIWFESEEGKGSTFYVRLPLMTDQDLGEMG